MILGSGGKTKRPRGAVATPGTGLASPLRQAGERLQRLARERGGGAHELSTTAGAHSNGCALAILFTAGLRRPARNRTTPVPRRALGLQYVPVLASSKNRYCTASTFDDNRASGLSHGVFPMFDLTKYAHGHRFRTRNVNDGFKVPPVRRVARGTIGAAGLVTCRYCATIPDSRS